VKSISVLNEDSAVRPGHRPEISTAPWGKMADAKCRRNSTGSSGAQLARRSQSGDRDALWRWISLDTLMMSRRSQSVSRAKKAKRTVNRATASQDARDNRRSFTSRSSAATSAPMCHTRKAESLQSHRHPLSFADAGDGKSLETATFVLFLA
jgi:hypothetical protein